MDRKIPSADAIDPKPYLDYLDREMRLLGILSTFCIAVASLIVGNVLNAASGSFLGNLWSNRSTAILFGLGAIIYAALEFFRQQRYYSYCYGQITRVWVRKCPTKKLLEELNRAEQWMAQRRYSRGKLALYAGFLQIGLVILDNQLILNNQWQWPIKVVQSMLYAHLFFWLVYGLIAHLALGQSVDVERPIRTWLKLQWETLRQKFTSKRER